MDQNPTRNRPVELAIILIFILALFAPLLTWTFQKDVFYSEAEKRELQPFPSTTGQDSVTSFTRSFDSYFQDHFGLREWLIHRYHREIKKRFGMSGVPLVLEGWDGWLFFSGDRILDDLKGHLQFSEEEEQRFRHLLVKKEAWLKKRGVAYIFTVAPNKQSIYPEYLPLHYQQLKKTSRLDHLLAGGPDDIGETLLNVSPYLREGKSAMRLYDKSDTHRNYQGAFLAYQAIMERTRSLFPDFQARENFHFSPNWQDGTGGDLALMIGRRQSIVEQRPMVDTRDFTTVEKEMGKELTSLLSLPQLKPFYSEKKSGQLRVLVLHDSFFNTINPFTSESFQEVLYIWQYYDATTLHFFNRENLIALLDIFQPDLIIEETVERFLPRFLTSNGWFDEKSAPAKGSAGKATQK